MAFVSDVKTVYPGKFILGTDTMGPDQRRIVVRAVGVSEGGAFDAADTVIVNKSDLLGPNGIEPSELSVIEAEWSVQGFDSVLVEFDDGTDEVMFRLTGAGFKDYRQSGGLHAVTTGGTGDIIVTTTGGAADSTYDLTLELKLKQ